MKIVMELSRNATVHCGQDRGTRLFIIVWCSQAQCRSLKSPRRSRQEMASQDRQGPLLPIGLGAMEPAGTELPWPSREFSAVLVMIQGC
jgi:hypothetical protein